ncbi:hypothetical protein [Halostella litorea]|uniref:hypothetical protein n=1 Tax=Halostella litorea TaxID=2528831 RepID=UPI001091D111|nr:hypothetical protein [Halostella litorea]
MPDWTWLATFASGCYLLAVTGALVGVPAEAGLPTAAVATGGALAVWALASWLDDGGYDRLGADRDGATGFFWLLVLYLPYGSLPTLAALDRLLDLPADLVLPATVWALTPVAAWLAFYGGLDRLGLDGRVFERLVGGWLAAVLVGFVAAATLGLTLSRVAVAAGFLFAQAVGVALAARSAGAESEREDGGGGDAGRTPNA